MTNPEQRPRREGDGGAAADRGRSDAEHTQLELLAETHRVVSLVVAAVRLRRQRIPGGVGTPSWWAASDEAKVAGLLVLAEHWLLRTPDEIAVDKLKAMSLDLSAGHDWTAQARRPSHEELQRRRGEAA